MTALVLADVEDLHYRGPSEQVDVIIGLGDLSEQLLLEAMDILRCNIILAVRGNHDPDVPFSSRVKDMHRRLIEVGKLTFGGFNGAWKYKPRGHYLYEQEEVRSLLRPLPRVNVFLAHNSPRHIHDKEDEVHYGFEAFNEYIERKKPGVFLHGHQHVNRETAVGNTRVIGIYGYGLIDLNPPS